MSRRLAGPSSGWLFFFFSSRRRHTRLQGDWSSDVCSSDLDGVREPARRGLPGLRHPRLEGDGVDREGLAAQARERRPGVGERVDTDAEPRDAVAAGDADQAEEQDDEDAEGVEVLQEAEVDNDDEADEDLEEQDELALGDQVRLAGLVDELGDLSHRLVHGKVLELAEDHQPEDEAEHADAEPEREQRAAADAADVHLAEVGNLETGLAAPVLGGPRGRLGEDRRRRDDRGQGEDEKRGKDLAIHARESPGFDGQSVTEIVATLRDAPEGVNAKVVELTGFVGRRYHPTGCRLRRTSGRRGANRKSPALRAGSAPRGTGTRTGRSARPPAAC